MSADNWGNCPNCNRELEKELTESYGKVSLHEYMAILDRKQAVESGDHTLREDYYFSLDEYTGELHISYSAQCTHCGFSYKLSEYRNILDEKKSE